jgi:trimethylguanosine synthase
MKLFKLLNKDICPFGDEYQIFWQQRHKLLTKFDQARVDAGALYTMIPWMLAEEIASSIQGKNIVDICSGVGAISIAFAQAGKSVTAVEIDKERVEMARHNLKLYGVSNKVQLIAADISSKDTLSRLAQQKTDTVWIDPPWGNGPRQYQKKPLIRLEDLALSGVDLRDLVEQIDCQQVVMRFPFNFDFAALNGNFTDKVNYPAPSGRLFCSVAYMKREQFLNIPRRENP